MSMIYFKVSADGKESVQSGSYVQLKERMKSYPKGLVGVESSIDGTMQHYLYHQDSPVSEIRRYPLRKMGGGYSCMKGYAALETKEAPYFFGTPQELTDTKEPLPELPEGCLFFVEQDKPIIEAIKYAAREKILKPSTKAPYFAELPLTQEQQEFLYSGLVKKGISFQEELSKLLGMGITIEEKERALRACIAQEPPELSLDVVVQRQIIQSEFLSLGSILNYPLAILGSEKIAGKGKPAPTIGAIRDYYVCCIQSHLQSKVANHDLSGHGNSAFALAKMTQLTDNPLAHKIVEAPTYQPLSAKDLICLGALNALLLLRGGDNTPEQLKRRMLDNPKLMDVFDEVYVMLCDLKNVVDGKTQTTTHPEYEMIYRELIAEIRARDEDESESSLDLSPLSQLKSVNPAYLALQALQPLAALHKLASQYDAAEAGERENISAALRAIQKDSSNPELSREATFCLFSHHLMSEEESVSVFLAYVAKGDQIAAERMVQKAPELLKAQGTFTDYSYRTFKSCTAYEYTWWSKDKHMRQMLERYIPDDETRVHLLGRIEKLEANGLTYTEPNREISGSRSFDLKPLIDAYNEYITVFNAWDKNGYVSAGEAAVVAAWMKVGLAQRGLPVHYINEYFRLDRSFDPMPDFNEPNLPRELTFLNYNTKRIETLFPLVLTDSSGLGVDFAFMRAGRTVAGALLHDCFASIDLAAVGYLDVVRKDDLRRSLEILRKPMTSESSLGFH